VKTSFRKKRKGGEGRKKRGGEEGGVGGLKRPPASPRENPTLSRRGEEKKKKARRLVRGGEKGKGKILGKTTTRANAQSISAGKEKRVTCRSGEKKNGGDEGTLGWGKKEGEVKDPGECIYNRSSEIKGSGWGHTGKERKGGGEKRSSGDVRFEGNCPYTDWKREKKEGR